MPFKTWISNGDIAFRGDCPVCGHGVYSDQDRLCTQQGVYYHMKCRKHSTSEEDGTSQDTSSESSEDESGDPSFEDAMSKISNIFKNLKACGLSVFEEASLCQNL